ncbi:MAG: hypothetical protein KF819_14930 [Labilithrix sp.]|nr:hypothetical protein [Labilithrix sp.]
MSRLLPRERGDFQTPLELARAVVARAGGRPAAVLEPTCGEGSFLLAASRAHPRAELHGFEIDARHVRASRARVPRARVRQASFFDVDWEREIAALPEPILILGNPPWVTSAELGSLGSRNVPRKTNFKALRGLEALTGKSNFDVSEWMIARLVVAAQRRRATIAMLCKAAVARKVIELAAAMECAISGALFCIDARAHFGAAVDAVLLVAASDPRGRDARWPIYASLDDARPRAEMSLSSGRLVADADAFERTAHLEGASTPEWRSGLKHDCAKVMELTERVNGMGERVHVEEEHVFPLLKSSDVANGVERPSRSVIVPQRALGEDTADLERRAPKLWRYLAAHRAELSARKSRIYRDRPPFSIFGVGPYSFARWKVAVSGLYKSFAPMLIPPYRGRPVMLDDTCYFLPFDGEAAAKRALDALRSPLAREFVAARVFWDAKRPINKALLQRLDLRALGRRVA